MPKREDERYMNLFGKHPAYCTCTVCTEIFLKRKGPKSVAGLRKKFFGREKVRRHPAGCSCATCNLLRSVGNLDGPDRRKSGFLKKLFGKQ